MSVDTRRPKNYRRSPVTEYRCQFCCQSSPKKEWKKDGQECPRCGRVYDAVMAQDAEDG